MSAAVEFIGGPVDGDWCDFPDHADRAFYVRANVLAGRPAAALIAPHLSALPGHEQKLATGMYFRQGAAQVARWFPF